MTFHARQQKAKVYEKSSVAGALILWHDHDAGDVVLLSAVLLLAEVADEMRALLVVLREYVEEERLDIVVERLVVEKELGEQTQVLTIDFGRVAVHLENGEVSRRRAVYFVAGWTER